jgi:CubicO group peptidase (beta-lactamase class C family)
MDAPVSGRCDDRFHSVREEFSTNFAERGEVGAAVTVVVGGRVVVELVGGWADEQSRRPWACDTLVNFYSAGKPIVATLLLQLVDAGLVGLDDPVASVWPEFAQHAKQSATLRHALCHRAGVPAIREELSNEDLWDWGRMASALAATAPWFEPGSRHVYHTNTYGHLVGEMVRRVTGEMPGTRLREVVEPLGADLWFGVGEGDLARCADVILVSASSPAKLPIDNGSDEASMILRGYFNPPGYSSFGVVNSTPWRSAQVPSTNGHGTASGIARFYAALLEPGRLLTPELLAEATSVQSEGYCPVLGEESRFGLGFQPTNPRRPFGPSPRSFGHFGTGGAVGFADPDAGVAFGYVMNHVIPRWQSTRNRALIDAVYGSLST